MSLEQQVLQAYYLKDAVPSVSGGRYPDAVWKPVVYGFAMEIAEDKRAFISDRMKTHAGMDKLKVWQSAADQKKIRDLARFNVLLQAVMIHIRRQGAASGDYYLLHNNSDSYERDGARANAQAADMIAAIMAFHDERCRRLMIDLEMRQRELILQQEAQEFADMMAQQQLEMRLLAARQRFNHGVTELAGLRQTTRTLIETIATEKIVMVLDRYLAAGRRVDTALEVVEAQLAQARLSQEKRRELKLKIATAIFDLIGNFAPFPINLVGGAISGAIKKGVEIVRDFADVSGSLLTTTAGALGTLAAGTPLAFAVTSGHAAASDALTSLQSTAEEGLTGAADRLRTAAQEALAGENIRIPSTDSVTQMLESAKDGAIRSLKRVVASKLAEHRLNGVDDRVQDLEDQRQIVLESARLDREFNNLDSLRSDFIVRKAGLENQVRQALESQGGITSPGVDMDVFERWCKIYIYALAVKARFEENRAAREIFALEETEIIFLRSLNFFSTAESWPATPPAGLPMYYKSSSVSSHYVFIRMMLDFADSEFTPIRVLFGSGDFTQTQTYLNQLYVHYYTDAENSRQEAARSVSWTLYSENTERARLHGAALFR